MRHDTTQVIGRFRVLDLSATTAPVTKEEMTQVSRFNASRFLVFLRVDVFCCGVLTVTFACCLTLCLPPQYVERSEHNYFTRRKV
jgi:hypothetical protein